MTESTCREVNSVAGARAPSTHGVFCAVTLLSLVPSDERAGRGALPLSHARSATSARTFSSSASRAATVPLSSASGQGLVGASRCIHVRRKTCTRAITDVHNNVGGPRV